MGGGQVPLHIIKAKGKPWDTMAEAIAKVFNLLFDSKLHPSMWSENMLLPLNKGDDLDDPDNYRGISISSCFAKLYSLVLNERLIDATEKFDLISQEQIGFLKRFRTTDHSFIINSIVNKLVKENNKTTYLASVDLRKAYDRIDMKLLIYKLRQTGTSSKLLATLEAMLQNIELIPNIGYSLLPSTHICGIKGCGGAGCPPPTNNFRKT